MRVLMMCELRGWHGLSLMLADMALNLRNLWLIGVKSDGLSGWLAHPPRHNLPKLCH